MIPLLRRLVASRFSVAILLASAVFAAWQMMAFAQQPVQQPAADLTAKFLQQYQATPRVTVPVAPGSAAVVIVKFTDYQCPACAATAKLYKPVLDKYEAEYPGAVKYVVKDFPLNMDCNRGLAQTIHRAACDAAVAMTLAQEQKHGAEMEDWLYANQQTLTPEMVRRAAEVIGGVKDFAAAYPRVIEQVKADAGLGQLLGVNATPTFFINGVKTAAIQPEFFDAAIAFELRRAGKMSK